jgi:hypothetical protein
MYRHAMARMTSTTVYLPEEELAALRTAARARKVPMAVLIREGIQKQLEWERETAHGTVS